MRAALLLAALVALACLAGAARALSPAELAFSMAEISAQATVSSAALAHADVDADSGADSFAESEAGDSFSNESSLDNENEEDASSEGLADADVFAEVDAEHSAEHEAAVEHVHTPGCKHGAEPVSGNPTVAIIEGKPVTRDEYKAASQPVTVPKLLDPQPVNGVRLPGKRTPGLHCEQRVSCGACLRLSSCLWNPTERACRPITEVGRLSRQAQWQFIATCDPNAKPTEQRTDRRDRSHLAQADIHRRLDNRKFNVIPVSLMEVSEQASGEGAADAQADANSELQITNGMQLFLDESPSQPIEASLTTEPETPAVLGQQARARADRAAELARDEAVLRSFLATGSFASGAADKKDAKALSAVAKLNQAKKLKQAPISFAVSKSGPPAKGGVDVWSVPTERVVQIKPLGLPTGVVPAESKLVIEQYYYIDKQWQGANVRVLYGYGYVAGKEASYGGWAGHNSCGYFALQREGVESPDGEVAALSGSLAESVPNHPRRCPNAAFVLREQQLIKPGSYVRASKRVGPKLAAATAVRDCSAWLNYDPITNEVNGAAPLLPAGTYSAAKGVVGSAPEVAGVVRSNQVRGFGVRYVTGDGKYALVAHPALAPTRTAPQGEQFFFVESGCVKFDEEAVKLTPA